MTDHDQQREIITALHYALQDAVAEHLEAIRAEWYRVADEQGIVLRPYQDVTWHYSSSDTGEQVAGFVLPGGLLPTSSSPPARAFNVAVERHRTAIVHSLREQARKRGIEIVGGALPWFPERNSFGLETLELVVHPNQERAVPDPRDKQPQQKPTTTPEGEKVDPSVADADDLKTDAEKAQEKESGGKPPQQ